MITPRSRACNLYKQTRRFTCRSVSLRVISLQVFLVLGVQGPRLPRPPRTYQSILFILCYLKYKEYAYQSKYKSCLFGTTTRFLLARNVTTSPFQNLMFMMQKMTCTTSLFIYSVLLTLYSALKMRKCAKLVIHEMMS